MEADPPGVKSAVPGGLLAASIYFLCRVLLLQPGKVQRQVHPLSDEFSESPVGFKLLPYDRFVLRAHVFRATFPAVRVAELAVLTASCSGLAGEGTRAHRSHAHEFAFDFVDFCFECLLIFSHVVS